MLVNQVNNLLKDILLLFSHFYKPTDILSINL